MSKATIPFQIIRDNQRRADGLSATLQIAKAGEHLVCSQLLLQGWNAFLAEAGLPYDVLVDIGDGKFYRIQVKSTCRLYSRRARLSAVAKHNPISLYRFPMRRSRVGDRRISMDACDGLAFVALDISATAFLPVSAVLKPGGFAVTLVEMKSRRLTYVRGAAGCDPATCGRFIEDYATFDPDLVDPFLKRRHH